MRRNLETNRKDLQYPCPDCPDKTINCRATCQREDFLSVKAMWAAMKQDKKQRKAADRYDFLSELKRQ